MGLGDFFFNPGDPLHPDDIENDDDADDDIDDFLNNGGGTP